MPIIFELIKNSDHAFNDDPSATPISNIFNFFFLNYLNVVRIHYGIDEYICQNCIF